MTYKELNEIQLHCRILSDSILMRNSRLGWVNKDVIDRDDETIKKEAEELKKLLEEILK